MCVHQLRGDSRGPGLWSAAPPCFCAALTGDEPHGTRTSRFNPSLATPRACVTPVRGGMVLARTGGHLRPCGSPEPTRLCFPVLSLFLNLQASGLSTLSRAFSF